MFYLEIARAGLGFGPPGQFPWSEPGPVIFQAFWVMGFSGCSGFLGYMGFWGFLGLESCEFAVILLSVCMGKWLGEQKQQKLVTIEDFKKNY